MGLGRWSPDQDDDRADVQMGDSDVHAGVERAVHAARGVECFESLIKCCPAWELTRRGRALIRQRWPRGVS